MASQITPDEPTDPQEEVDEEEETPGEALPPLDKGKLISDATKRFDKMVAKGRKDVGSTFAAQVLTLAQDQQETLEAAISDLEAQAKATFDAAVRALANERVAAADERGIGEIARRHLLAVQVQNGDFNQ